MGSIILGFYCNRCNTHLYDIRSVNNSNLPQSYNLCFQCYEEKNLNELGKIAKLSSELVIKELAKIEPMLSGQEENDINEINKWLETKLFTF